MEQQSLMKNIFPKQKPPKDLFSYRSYCKDLPERCKALKSSDTEPFSCDDGKHALGDADTSLHNHKNCLSPQCCRHSKLFSSFYSFKNLPSFFTTLNNKDFEAIKSECVVYLCYNCEKAISHNVHRLEADALIIALQRLC